MLPPERGVKFSHRHGRPTAGPKKIISDGKPINASRGVSAVTTFAQKNSRLSRNLWLRPMNEHREHDEADDCGFPLGPLSQARHEEGLKFILTRSRPLRERDRE